ncbi:MAG: DUF3179 domain-containing protein [Methanobacteriota archaeon]
MWVRLATVLVGTLFAPTAGADHVPSDEIRQACDFGNRPPRLDCGGGIPSIQRPTMSREDWLDPDDAVLGIAIGGDARAYPIRVLDWHEIANDDVGGVPVAVTYCPLCATGIAFDRRVEGRVLSFHVSGFLYKNDLVMKDSETGTLWSQVLGQGIRGELDREDLDIVTASTLPWREWKRLHPETLLLQPPRCGDGSTGETSCNDRPFQRPYDRFPYGDYGVNRQIGISPHQGGDVKGLHPKAIVLGLRAPDSVKAYHVPSLEEARVVNDRVGDEPVVVTFASGGAQAFLRDEGRTFRPGAEDTMVDENGRAYHAATGVPLAGGQPLAAFPDQVRSFWFAWLDFHPATALYTTPAGTAAEPPRGDERSVPAVGGGAAVLLGFALAAAWALVGGRRRR